MGLRRVVMLAMPCAEVVEVGGVLDIFYAVKERLAEAGTSEQGYAVEVVSPVPTVCAWPGLRLDFFAACIAVGAPPEWFSRAETIGPLASFDAADRWVEHPYRAGIVLIGDAAAVSDPCFGCGMGLTLRDVRVLRDRLLATTDWDAAAHAYADEHDRYYGAMRIINQWMRELYYERGSEHDARRARALPRLAQEPERAPDLLGLGPDSPIDDIARRRFFGDDWAPLEHGSDGAPGSRVAKGSMRRVPQSMAGDAAISAANPFRRQLGEERPR
jgi:hypothetical protein